MTQESSEVWQRCRSSGTLDVVGVGDRMQWRSDGKKGRQWYCPVYVLGSGVGITRMSC